MWHGKVRLETPMLFAIGFLLIFLLGGITGVMVVGAARSTGRSPTATSSSRTSTTC